jgi:hypothetical protein
MTSINLTIAGADYTFSEKDLKANMFAALGNAQCEIERLNAKIEELQQPKPAPALPGGELVKAKKGGKLSPAKTIGFLAAIGGRVMEPEEEASLLDRMEENGVWLEFVPTAKAAFVVLRWGKSSEFQKSFRKRVARLVAASGSWELTSYRGKVAAKKTK